VTVDEIKSIWSPHTVVCGDQLYHTPAKMWVLEVARRHLRMLPSWRNTFDCDDFAFSLKLESQRRHRDKLRDGLAVGGVFYVRDSGSHAVNWSITSGKRIWFLEPAAAKEIKLTEKERDSVFFVYC
jgi:hypothetical protein